MNKIIGVTLIVLAIAIAVIPMFTDCESQGASITTASGKSIPMVCHWSGVAELGAAIPLAAIGAFMIFNRKKIILFTLGILGAIIGALVIAFPTELIGVCGTPTMLCHTAMRPALVSLGVLTILVGGWAALYSRKLKE